MTGVRLFHTTAKDAWPTLCGLANVALIALTFFYFDALPLWALVPLFLLQAFCFCWNLHAIAHAFVHNPFFASAWLNRLYSLVLSLGLGIPQSIHYLQHMNHHSGDNDAPGPDGKTRDWVSTYRHGRDGKPEGFIAYCLLSFLRSDLVAIAQAAMRRGRGHVIQVLLELVFLVVIGVGMLLLNWRYFVFFYLPCYYAGWALIFAENYFLHYGAQPGNRYANSVSSYHAFTNWLFFNNGYHQEHHSEPKMHWTRMEEVRLRLAPQLAANNTPILKGPHLTLFLEQWLNRRRASRTTSPSSVV